MFRLPTGAALALLLAFSASPSVAASSSTLGSPLTGASESPITVRSGEGLADVDVDIVSADGGAVRTSSGLDASTAFDFPRFVQSASPPRGVVKVTNSDATDNLAPRWADFTIGADFKLDRVSTGSLVDNGDNLVQRGTFGSQSQYKIDADDGRISCRIKGSAGVVMVKSSVRADAGSWYRARCSRVRTEVTLAVTEYRADGTTRVVRDERAGRTGALTWVSPSTPLSVGGKLTTRGTIMSSTSDQFNGSIGGVVLTIDS